MKKLLAPIFCLFLACATVLGDGAAGNAGYQGSVTAGQTVTFKFPTYVQSTGVPTAIVGGVISLYQNSTTAETTTGVTFTASFDSRTGLNNVAVDTTGFTAGDYTAVITTGTVGTSVVGYTVGSFSVGVPREANLKQVNGGSTGATAGKLELDQLVIAPAGENDDAVRLLGNGDGRGLYALHGAAFTGDVAESYGAFLGDPYESPSAGANIYSNTKHGLSLYSGGASYAALDIEAAVTSIYGSGQVHFTADTNVDVIKLEPSGTGKALNALGQVYVAPTNTNDDAVALVPNGTGLPLSGLSTLVKGVAFAKYPIWMLSSAGVAVAGVTPSCTISKDGGAFAAPAATAAVSDAKGYSTIALTATEDNANTLAMVCTGAGAQPYRTVTTPQR